jgi:hypothetical protein
MRHLHDLRWPGRPAPRAAGPSGRASSNWPSVRPAVSLPAKCNDTEPCTCAHDKCAIRQWVTAIDTNYRRLVLREDDDSVCG